MATPTEPTDVTLQHTKVLAPYERRCIRPSFPRPGAPAIRAAGQPPQGWDGARNLPSPKRLDIASTDIPRRSLGWPAIDRRVRSAQRHCFPPTHEAVGFRFERLRIRFQFRELFNKQTLVLWPEKEALPLPIISVIHFRSDKARIE